MFIYEGKVFTQDNGKLVAVIFAVRHDEPNHDTVMEREVSSMDEGMIWIDDEISRLTTGRGIWEP